MDAIIAQINLIQGIGLLGCALLVIFLRAKANPWWYDAGAVRQIEESCEKRVADAQQRMRDEEAECERCKTENKQLWAEKVADARESQELAKAYLRMREREYDK